MRHSRILTSRLPAVLSYPGSEIKKKQLAIRRAKEKENKEKEKGRKMRERERG